MSQKIKNFTNTSWPFLIFIAISMVMLPTSYIYQISPFSDINTMIAMSRALAHGVIPFVDIFEQRGPYMYILHLISLLPGEGIHWIYILELINFYIIYRILIHLIQLGNSISANKSRFYAVTAISVFLFSPSLFYGAAPEEFCLVPITYTIYVLLKGIIKANTSKSIMLIPNIEILLLGIGLGWTVMIKFATIGTLVGFFITYGLYLIFKKQIGRFFKTVGLATLGLVLAISPVIVYYLSIRKLSEFAYQYFSANSGLSAYTVSSAIVKFIHILGNDLLSNIGFLLIIAPFLVFGIIKSTTYKKPNGLLLLSSTFFIQLFMSLLIMRYANAYTQPSMLIFTIIAVWNAPQVIQSFQTASKLQKIILTFIFSAITIFLAFFLNGAFLHLDKTIAFTKISEFKKQNDASYIQGKMIESNGGGSIEAYANVPWGIYEYANNYPKLKYFDQTTIPYRSQRIAGDSQYGYIKNKNADWVQASGIQITTKKLDSEGINLFLKLAHKKANASNKLSSQKSISPIVDAPIQRKLQYPTEYYEYAKTKTNEKTFIIEIPPKALLKNYVLVNAHYMTSGPLKKQITLNRHRLKIDSAYLLFTTKENAKKHHMKTIPLKVIE